MANNLSSNVSERVASVFAKEFESNRVITKTIDTSTVAGANGITNATGDTVYIKRPTQWKAFRTQTGDLTGLNNDIGVGRVAAKVGQYISVPITWSNLEEVTQLNQLQEILRPAAEEVANVLEAEILDLMIRNAGLTYGAVGTAATTWEHVASAGALMKEVGVPSAGDKFYLMNSFTQTKLASAQSGLNAADSLVRTAWENAQIAGNFGGLRAISSNALGGYTSGATADRAGALAATPDATWATHKDTMIQTLNLTGLTASTANAVRPGDVLEFTGRYHINVKNRRTLVDATGAPVKYRMTVVSGGNTNSSGEVTDTATNAAIYGASGLDAQYQTIDSPLTSGDVVTILGSASTNYQPNLFYHRSSVVLATLDLPKLHATDTLMASRDGLKMRITKYSDGTKNTQNWRIDMLPVLGIVNPLFIGKGFGTT